jgi:hypothetical protein
MPDLSDILTATEEADIDVLAGKLHVVYDPNYLTPALEEAVHKAEKDKQARVLAQMCSDMVHEWDLTREGVEYAPTFENCMELPLTFLAEVIGAVFEESKPDESEKNS